MTKDMTNDIQTTQPGGPQQGEIILYQPDETVRLEVRLEDDTVWLTTSQMALLFDREESNIRRHILNVFSEDELERSNNVQNLHVNGVPSTTASSSSTTTSGTAVPPSRTWAAGCLPLTG